MHFGYGVAGSSSSSSDEVNAEDAFNPDLRASVSDKRINFPAFHWYNFSNRSFCPVKILFQSPQKYEQGRWAAQTAGASSPILRPTEMSGKNCQV